MRRSRCELYVHCVWATYRRSAILHGEIERRVHRCIQSEAEKLGCTVLALNGMPDHVHLLVQIPSKIAIAQLMKTVKGVSSSFARQQFQCEEPFGWQDNYAAYSVSRSHLDRVIRYVENQKQRHDTGELWPEWEDTDEDWAE